MVNMIHGTGVRTIADDQTWRYGEQLPGTVSITLDLATFSNATKAKKEKYLTGMDDSATEVYIKSGLPLALITSGASNGLYGPYDPEASDGRQERVAGLLESQVKVNVTVGGWEVEDSEVVGMRFRGNVIVKNLPVVPADTVAWNGDFVSVDPETGTTKRLPNTVAAAAAVPGVGA